MGETAIKALTIFGGVAMVTTLVLPKRITVGVIQAVGSTVSSVFGTVMGTK